MSCKCYSVPLSQCSVDNQIGSVYTSTLKNRHDFIVDWWLCLTLFQYKPPHAYYGVFDGHAGIDAAVYSAAHLHQYMIQNPQYETNPEAALKHAFHITDTNFIKKASKEVGFAAPLLLPYLHHYHYHHHPHPCLSIPLSFIHNFFFFILLPLFLSTKPHSRM